MKILFVYPNIHNTSRINLGIAYLSAYLKKHGHQVQLFDTTFYKEEGLLSDDDLREMTLQVKGIDITKHGVEYRSAEFLFSDFKEMIHAFKPDILALNCIDATYFLGRNLIKSLNQEKPFTIVGGARVTVDPESIISEDWVDAVCIGEGEESLVELCAKMEGNEDFSTIKNLWVKKDGEIIKNGRRDLIDINALPAPDWDNFSEYHLIRPFAGKVYRMGFFEMSRGCPFKCSYCINQFYADLNKGHGTYCRQKDPAKVVQEIKDKVEKYNLNFVMFYDDLFPTTEYIDEFCRLYKEIGLPFFINMRPEVVKKEVIRKLVDVGLCCVAMGIESGDYEFRKKVLKRNYSNQVVIDAFKIVKSFNIRTSSFNILGFPFETREQIFNTIELNKIVLPTSSTVSYFYPYRGTPLRKVCVENNFFNPELEDTLDIAHRTSSALTMPQISQEELTTLCSRFQLYVKLPKIIWPLIKYTEKNRFGSKAVYKLLVKFFELKTSKEATWHFPVKLPSQRQTAPQ